MKINRYSVATMNYFKDPEPLKTKKGDFQIKCCGFGSVEKYDCSQCNKDWNEIT